MSQSLPLFRAFQLVIPHIQRALSNNLVAIPSFIQGISTCQPWNMVEFSVKLGRNPFLYSGHFNTKSRGLCWSRMMCRNPFLYSGHFNAIEQSWEQTRKQVVAIPSFIQGISTWSIWRLTPPPRKEGRNPFLYSGHFNIILHEGVYKIIIVAIPSFIQGISTNTG